MLWVLVFGGIGLAGLVMVVAYAVWLAHKAGDLFAEVRVLTDRGSQIASLLGEIRPPSSASPATSTAPSAPRPG